MCSVIQNSRTNIAFSLYLRLQIRSSSTAKEKTSNSDSRYPERLINSEGECVQFYHFQSFKKEKIQREAWIRACCQATILFARNILISVDCTLLVIMDRP